MSVNYASPRTGGSSVTAVHLVSDLDVSCFFTAFRGSLEPLLICLWCICAFEGRGKVGNVPRQAFAHTFVKKKEKASEGER